MGRLIDGGKERRMNELISREKAIECLDVFLDKQCDRERTKARGFSDNDIWASVNMAYDALTAEKVGKWIIKDIDVIHKEPEAKARWMRTGAFPHRVYCSNCYATYVPNDRWQIWTDKPGDGGIPRNYCPNCGAKMDTVEGVAHRPGCD